MSLRDYQALMERIYGERDRLRGAEKTLLWLLSEAGEVADAFIKNDLDALEAEVADLLAWLLSFCNLSEIDLQDAFVARYGSGCPRCKSLPCKCPLI